MRRFLATLALALVGLPAAGSQAAPRPEAEQLVIGITQFPSTLHPSIDAMAAKSYVLAMARRPFTAYDADWQLICMLCTELPTLENGLAVLEPGRARTVATASRSPTPSNRTPPGATACR